MIVNIIFFILGTVSNFIVGILAGLNAVVNFAIPHGVFDGFSFMFSQLNYLRGVIDIPAFGDALTFLIAILTLVYSVRAIIFLINLVPWLHSKQLPTKA